MKKPIKKNVFRKIFGLSKDYFIHSNEKLVSWLLLIGAIACVIGLVGLMLAFSWLSAAFFGALAAKTLIPFLITLAKFAGLISGYVVISRIKNFLVEKLCNRWRTWLTNKMIQQLLKGENTYLDLKRTRPDIRNISQRIQEDIKKFVDSTINLSMGLLNAILTLGTFIGTLWVVGGALTVALLGLNIIIPGYLVWIALIIAIGATAITHWIGKPRSHQNKVSEEANADLRQTLELLNQDAENIAEDHAEAYYEDKLKQKVEDIRTNANQQLNTQTKLGTFQDFYMQLSPILPYLLSAPLYFAGLIQLPQLMQIGMAFQQVNSALNYFVESYDALTDYQAAIERVVDLKQAIETPPSPLTVNPKSIARSETADATISIRHLSIMYPRVESGTYMMRNLNIQLVPGERTLIQGTEGLGKSTVFKAICGSWKYGEGSISVPAGKKLYFLPQIPTLTSDTLMAVLAYKESTKLYLEEEYKTALVKVGLPDFIGRLNETCHWSTVLSGGQKQKISFARALLKKPDWLFLDESTASLTEESEAHLYGLLKKELPETTIVSIGHRSTIKPYHTRILFFRANAEKEITVESTPVQALAAAATIPLEQAVEAYCDGSNCLL